jgi:hypothetical protein
VALRQKLTISSSGQALADQGAHDAHHVFAPLRVAAFCFRRLDGEEFRLKVESVEQAGGGRPGAARMGGDDERADGVGQDGNIDLGQAAALEPAVPRAREMTGRWGDHIAAGAFAFEPVAGAELAVLQGGAVGPEIVMMAAAGACDRPFGQRGEADRLDGAWLVLVDHHELAHGEADVEVAAGVCPIPPGDLSRIGRGIVHAVSDQGLDRVLARIVVRGVVGSAAGAMVVDDPPDRQHGHAELGIVDRSEGERIGL